MYRIEIASRRVEKEIAVLPNAMRERIIQAMRKLGENPRPSGARKMIGEMRGAWRIRVGGYRVIYDVDDERRLVVILAVLHRREAYQRR